MKTLKTQFIFEQAAFTQRLLKKIDSQLNIHGLSFTEYLIMNALDSAPKLMMRRIKLAESVGLSASGVTRILLPMEKLNLVEKESNPRDARVSLVKLSEPGKVIFDEASISFSHMAKQLTIKLNEIQIKKMLGFIVQLTA